MHNSAVAGQDSDGPAWPACLSGSSAPLCFWWRTWRRSWPALADAGVPASAPPPCSSGLNVDMILVICSFNYIQCHNRTGAKLCRDKGGGHRSANLNLHYKLPCGGLIYVEK